MYSNTGRDKVDMLVDAPPPRIGPGASLCLLLVVFVMSEEEEGADVGEGVLMGEEISPESAHSPANTHADV